MYSNYIQDLVEGLNSKATLVATLLHSTGLNIIFHSVSEKIVNLVKTNLALFFSSSSKSRTNEWNIFYTNDPTAPDVEMLKGFIVSEIPFGTRYQKQSSVFIHYDRWNISVLADTDKRLVIVSGQSEKDCAISVIRLITQILLFTIKVNQKFTLLHAASVVMDERIVAFVSPSGDTGEQVIESSGHGKTTAQLTAALYLGASIHTGDILIVCEQGIFAYPDIYKINKAQVVSHTLLGPLRHLPEYQGHVCLTSNGWKLIGVNCAGDASSNTVDTLCFVDLKPKRRKYWVKTISVDEALQELRGSVRYDHLTDNLHNPNLLNLPRKPIEQLRLDAAMLVERLVKGSQVISLRGGVQLEKLTIHLKSLGG